MSGLRLIQIQRGRKERNGMYQERVMFDLLPSLDFVTDAFQNFLSQTLGEVVCQLISGSNSLNSDSSIFDMLPKEVPLYIEVFSPGSSTLG